MGSIVTSFLHLPIFWPLIPKVIYHKIFHGLLLRYFFYLLSAPLQFRFHLDGSKCMVRCWSFIQRWVFSQCSYEQSISLGTMLNGFEKGVDTTCFTPRNLSCSSVCSTAYMYFNGNLKVTMFLVKSTTFPCSLHRSLHLTPTNTPKPNLLSLHRPPWCAVRDVFPASQTKWKVAPFHSHYSQQLSDPAFLSTHPPPCFCGPFYSPPRFPQEFPYMSLLPVSLPVHWWHCLWHGPSKTQIWSCYSLA